MSVISFDKRLRKIEEQRNNAIDAELRALSDEDLVALLRAYGGTPEDEALITLLVHRHPPAACDAASAGARR